MRRVGPRGKIDNESLTIFCHTPCRVSHPVCLRLSVSSWHHGEVRLGLTIWILFSIQIPYCHSSTIWSWKGPLCIPSPILSEWCSRWFVGYSSVEVVSAGFCVLISDDAVFCHPAGQGWRRSEVIFLRLWIWFYPSCRLQFFFFGCIWLLLIFPPADHSWCFGTSAFCPVYWLHQAWLKTPDATMQMTP